ncbi:MAG: hypothetical protein JXX14_22095 [Deltaproteobacteria bacterium]|nr:hypothetical protein [Deltaproteobacteria bacterium]
MTGGATGKTTRYWDCCKPSCGWNNGGYTPTTCCTQSNSVHTNSWDSQSGCAGGDVYTCWSNRPWAVNSKLAYGFTAVQAGSSQFGCGECIQLEFTSGTVEGKTMIVQVTNIGGDVSSNQFDLMIPGGGVGLFDGCSKQWGVSSSELGSTYGGFYDWCLKNENTLMAALECTIDKCNSVFANKPDLKDGCMWFIKWFRGANNPAVKWQKVNCPQELKAISGM